MFKEDAEEAVPIVHVTMDAILNWVPNQGRAGFDVRRACGEVKARTLTYLRSDTLGEPLAECFRQARLAGMSLVHMDYVRAAAADQGAQLVGAIVVRDACIELALSEMGLIIASTTFVSREDVESTKAMINAAFEPVEEEVADQMDSMSFRALIQLHSAITAHLVETARPLPRMLKWQFMHVWPTLVISHKLYADAGHADELRQENKVVHPGFTPSSGRGLSG